jgi:hypothetical protein
VKESLQALLLLIFGDRAVGPRRAELRDLIDADLLQRMESAALAPRQELFAQQDILLADGRVG